MKLKDSLEITLTLSNWTVPRSAKADRGTLQSTNITSPSTFGLTNAVPIAGVIGPVKELNASSEK